MDLEALVNADVLAGLGIFTDQGLNVEALVCAIVDGSVDLDLLGHDLVAADLLVALGLDADVILDDNGLGIDIGTACGCAGDETPDDVDGPNNPNNPNNPDDPGTSNPVPEPATAALGLMAAGGLTMAMRRRRNNA